MAKQQLETNLIGRRVKIARTDDEVNKERMEAHARGEKIEYEPCLWIRTSGRIYNHAGTEAKICGVYLDKDKGVKFMLECTNGEVVEAWATQFNLKAE